MRSLAGCSGVRENARQIPCGQTWLNWSAMGRARGNGLSHPPSRPSQQVPTCIPGVASACRVWGSEVGTAVAKVRVSCSAHVLESQHHNSHQNETKRNLQRSTSCKIANSSCGPVGGSPVVCSHLGSRLRHVRGWQVLPAAAQVGEAQGCKRQQTLLSLSRTSDIATTAC